MLFLLLLWHSFYQHALAPSYGSIDTYICYVRRTCGATSVALYYLDGCCCFSPLFANFSTLLRDQILARNANTAMRVDRRIEQRRRRDQIRNGLLFDPPTSVARSQRRGREEKGGGSLCIVNFLFFFRESLYIARLTPQKSRLRRSVCNCSEKILRDDIEARWNERLIVKLKFRLGASRQASTRQEICFEALRANANLDVFRTRQRSYVSAISTSTITESNSLARALKRIVPLMQIAQKSVSLHCTSLACLS